MNKGELIESVASSAGLSKADAGRAVDAVIDSISGALQGGSQVSFGRIWHVYCEGSCCSSGS